MKVALKPQNNFPYFIEALHTRAIWVWLPWKSWKFF